jgi:hypothetical protein
MLMPVEGFEIVAMDGIELFNFRAANRAIEANRALIASFKKTGM